MLQRHEVYNALAKGAACLGAIAAPFAFDAAFLRPDTRSEITLEAGSPVQKLGGIVAADCIGTALNVPGCIQSPLEQIATTTSSSTTTTTLPAVRPVPTHASRDEPRIPPHTTTTITLSPPPMEVLSVDASSGLSSATPEEREYLLCIADEESDFDPTEYNPAGPYYGKYQFHQDTWDGFVVTIGLGDLVGVDIRQVPEAVQDYVALQFLRAERRGEWGPDPRCAHHLRAA